MSVPFLLFLSGAGLLAGYSSFLFIDPHHLHVSAFLSASFILFAGFLIFLNQIPRLASLNRRKEWSAAVVILLFSLLFRLILLQTTPSLSDDIYRYLWDGRVQLSAINPYLYAPSSNELAFLRDENHALINHPTIRTIYPPLAQMVFRLGAWVKPTIGAQRALFVLFDAASILLLMLLLKKRGRSFLWSTVYAWNPLVVVEFAGSGHNDSLMIFLLLAAFAFWEFRRPRLSVAAFAMASLSKFIPVVMIPWLLFQRKWRYAALYVGVIGLGCLPYLFTIGHGISGIHEPSGLKSYASDWVFNPSLYGLLGYAIPNPTVRKIALGFLLIGFSIWWARRHKTDPVAYAFGCIAALLIVSPVVYPWYVAWLVPFLCFRPRAWGLVWAGIVPLTYHVLIRYWGEGVWQLAPWVMAVEYGLVFSLLALEGLKAYLRFRSRVPSSRPPSENLLPASVTVIIPALNEEKAIRSVIDEIPKEHVCDILVVDNGSTDKTKEAAQLAGARVVRQPVAGYGRAVLTGIKELEPGCNVVVILDGDHSDFPEELPKLLAPLYDGRADLVIGSRTQAALPGSLMPQQRFGNWLTCALIRLLYGQRFSDMGPFRAIRRDALEALGMVDETFGWNVEMQVKALKQGFSILEVPVRYRPRIGKSKISGTLKGSVRAGVIILWSIYKYGLKKEKRVPSVFLNNELFVQPSFDSRKDLEPQP